MKQGSQEWLDMRSRHAATASEYGTAIGVGYKSRRKYMKQKLGFEAPEEPNWRMKEGNYREPWVAELYYRIMASCGHPVTLETDGFQEDPWDRRLGGSVDRLVSDATGERWLLEIKTCPDGDMRVEIPVTHLVQMAGLCQCYGFDYAHYICSSYGQGILIARVDFCPGLWADTVYPRLREFADMWSRRQLPGKMAGSDREALISEIRARCTVTEIPAVRYRIALLQLTVDDDDYKEPAL